MVKRFPSLVVACLLLSGCGGQKSDLITVAKQMDALVNANDVDGFAKLMSDDVVTKAPDGSLISGKDAVQKWVAGLMPGFHVESKCWQQSGDTVTWELTVQSDAFAKMGVNPAEFNTMAVFSGGKLHYFWPAFTQQTGNKLRFMQFYAEVVNGGDIGAIDKYVEDKMIEHQPLPPGMPTGKEGVKAYFTMIRAAYPDLHGTPIMTMADGDKVLVLGKWEGTNKGKFMGMPATNKKLSWTVSDVIRLVDGKAVEHWGLEDLSEQTARSRGH